MADEIPQKRRATALASKTAGAPVVMGIGALAGPWLGAALGWEYAFVALGFVGIVALITVLIIYPRKPMETKHRLRRDGRQLAPGFSWVPVGAFFLILGGAPFMNWSVSFLTESHSLSAPAAGWTSSTAFLAAAVLMVLFARATDRRRGVGRFRFVAACSGGAVFAAVANAVSAESFLWLAIVGVGSGAISVFAAIGVLHAAVVDAAPAAVGKASGVAMTGYYIGALASPAAFGAVTDWRQGYALAWWLAAAALAAAAYSFLRATAVLPDVPAKR